MSGQSSPKKQKHITKNRSTPQLQSIANRSGYWVSLDMLGRADSRVGGL